MFFAEFMTEIIYFVVFLLTSILFGYYILLTVFLALFPDLIYREAIAPSISNKDLTTLFIFIFIINLIGFTLKFLYNKIKFQNPLSLPKKEILVFYMLSFFLAYFFTKSIWYDKPVNLGGLFIFSLLLFILLPQAVEFICTFNLDYLNKLVKKTVLLSKRKFIVSVIFIKKAYYFSRTVNYKDAIVNFIKSLKQKGIKMNWKRIIAYVAKSFRKLISSLIPSLKLIFSILKYYIFLSIFILLVFLVSGFTVYRVHKYLAYQQYQKEHLSVTKIKPNIIIQAQKVKVDGYNFGWESNKYYRLMSDYGKINEIKLWTDNQIIFTVPLFWKVGRINLWVERSKDDKYADRIIKSNKVIIAVSSRWDFYPTQEELNNKIYLFNRLIKKIKRSLYFKKIE